jgi:hypothetical protein
LIICPSFARGFCRHLAAAGSIGWQRKSVNGTPTEAECVRE